MEEDMDCGDEAQLNNSFLANEIDRDSKMEGILIEESLVVLAGHQSCLFLLVTWKKHPASGIPLCPKFH